MTSKHRAVWDWLRTCPHIQDLFFNAARVEDGATQLVPGESITETYLDGSSLRTYDCALNRFMPISFDANDIANIEDAVDLDGVAEWVEAQNAARNFPEFPEGCQVQEIKVNPNESGYIAMMEAGIAKYMLQFQIEFLKG